MKPISLDMAIGAAAALKAWQDLPESAPKPQADAYWRRFQLLRDAEAAGTPLLDVPEVTYLEPPTLPPLPSPPKAAPPSPTSAPSWSTSRDSFPSISSQNQNQKPQQPCPPTRTTNSNRKSSPPASKKSSPRPATTKTAFLPSAAR